MIAKKSFKKEIAVDDIFISSQHQEAIARLKFVIANRGLGVLFGETGSGKSTIIRTLCEKLDLTKYIVCYINNSHLTPKELYCDILYSLAVEPYSYISKIKKQFEQVVLDIYKNQQKQLVIIIDNAHMLPAETILEIRYITCFEMDSFSPMSVLLFGQEQLWATLRMRTFEPVFYCLDSHYQLSGLDFKQTKDYIIHQLKLSEVSMLFPDEVVTKICDCSRGLPRIINIIARHCLIDMESNSLELVDMNVLKRALNDLNYNY